SSLLQTSFPKNVRLEQALATNLPCIEGDPSQVQQVIMNLVINAAEAIPPASSGHVVVRTGVQDLSEEDIRSEFSTFEIRPGRFVMLEVEDNGVGMEEATLSHIFDPFFTTKFTGRGLGLAAVMGIVRSHRGALKIRSAPGRGSTFQMYLPAA